MLNTTEMIHVESHPLPLFDRVEQWDPPVDSYEAAMERMTMEANSVSIRYNWEKACAFSARMQAPYLKGDFPELKREINRLAQQYKGDPDEEI